MAYLEMSNAEVFKRAIRSPVDLWYKIDAYYDGVIVAADLRPTGGAITDTTKPGVRRTLSLELAPEPGLFDTLAPLGTALGVLAQVRLANREVISIPMGAFDIDAEKMSEAGGTLSITAPDRWAFIQRARFIRPYSSTPGIAVTDQIVNLLRGAIGDAAPINVTATSTAAVGALTWETDRDKAILELAKAIGAWVYFDRSGVATIADMPTIGDTADWLIDASASGVLVELDRERSRAGAYNVVVVSSSAAEGESFASQYVWDDDPNSPTYAGTDPLTGADAGPFGIVPYFYDTPIIHDVPSARGAGRTILARTAGLASQMSLGMVPNPAVDAGDALDVLPPGTARSGIVGYTQTPGTSPFGTAPFGTSGFGGSTQANPIIGRVSVGAVLERHVADTVTHPLARGPVQSIEGRSTRLDES